MSGAGRGRRRSPSSGRRVRLRPPSLSIGARLTVLRIDGVTKRFGGLLALSAVGFEVSAGEIVSLVGPNGAGKTTLFNIISGVYGADEGSVHLDGRDVTGWATASAGRARSRPHVPERAAVRSPERPRERHGRADLPQPLRGARRGSAPPAGRRRPARGDRTIGVSAGLGRRVREPAADAERAALRRSAPRRDRPRPRHRAEDADPRRADGGNGGERSPRGRRAHGAGWWRRRSPCCSSSTT